MLQLQLAGRGAPPATSLTILPVEVGTGPPGGPPSSLMVCLSGSFGSRGHPGRVQRPPDSQVSCQRPSSGGAKSQPDHAFLLGAVLCFPVQVHHLMAGCHVPRVQGTPVIVVAVQSRGWCRQGHSGQGARAPISHVRGRQPPGGGRCWHRRRRRSHIPGPCWWCSRARSRSA